MTLSVVMCNYNYASYIQYALDGIVAQSVTPRELILVDDASTDNSLALIHPYLSRYSWIKLYKNPKNIGAYRSAQFALEIAKSDYIYFASSDDRVLSGFFEITLAALSAFPNACLCCSKPAFFEENETYPEKKIETKGGGPYWMSPLEVQKRYQKLFWIAGHTTIYKREAVLEAGGVQESIGHLCDWFFSQVIAYRYGLVFVPQVLAAKRNHKDALSTKNGKDISRYTALLHLLDKSEYKDVKKYFFRARILGVHFPCFEKALKKLNMSKWLRCKLLFLNKFRKSRINKFRNKILKAFKLKRQ